MAAQLYSNRQKSDIWVRGRKKKDSEAGLWGC
jgi:hypothetical protein